ncbi:30S ribosome-binding factor RbfA [Govanella unica]|uniref:Ribosome-binding factor A n=1 Tax=Govanella unica TaxID=2975056 RepID=A0A9X3TZI8_9PROT|nr:30S ribosome-binding factor RbfA [Govania unica]MDA5194620.1 30S ribosome-binding factor RbfA [Govania unica]
MIKSSRSGSKSGATAGPSMRLLRVGEMLRHALSEVLARGELRDPALLGVSITVSEVRPSPDLRQATVFIMPLGGADVTPVLEGLARSAGHLAHLVSDKVTLRYFPRFIFRLDPSFETAGKIESLLRDPRVAQDLDHPAEDDQDTDEGL